MYWIWKAFPKCCTPFSNTIPSELHNRLYLSIFFLKIRPIQNSNDHIWKRENSTENDIKVRHPIRIIYCVPWKKIFNSIHLRKSDVLFNYFPVSNPGNSDWEDDRQKERKKKERKRERDTHNIFYLNFLKNSAFKRSN